MQLLATINPEGVTPETVQSFRLRQSARAVVFDSDGNIALLHVTKHGYHKLPGGGMDTNETIEAAVRRECREEIGCEIEITGALGDTIEFRKRYKIKQESFCCLATVAGAKGKPKFTDDETQNGFTEIWLPFAQALRILETDRSDDYSWQFIQARDLAFLREAAGRLGKKPIRVL